MRVLVGLVVMVLITVVALAGALGQFLPALILLLLVRGVFRAATRQAASQRPAPARAVAPPQTVWMVVQVWMPPPARRCASDAETRRQM